MKMIVRAVSLVFCAGLAGSCGGSPTSPPSGATITITGSGVSPSRFEYLLAVR